MEVAEAEVEISLVIGGIETSASYILFLRRVVRKELTYEAFRLYPWEDDSLRWSGLWLLSLWLPPS